MTKNLTRCYLWSNGFLNHFYRALGGCDVVDLGCGTGRWLEVLKRAGARSLVGVDLSREMLNLAEAKLGGAARLLCADYADAALASDSADIVFCNFVLSYIDDAEQFFRLVRRILRPGGLLYLSDVHPETASAQNWRRGVHADNSFREIRTHRRAISAVVELCRKAGLELGFALEPPFGDIERVLFEQSGKREYFESIREFPAIYLLRLAKPEKPRKLLLRESKTTGISRLYGGRFAFGPGESTVAEMRIQDSRIEEICGAASDESFSVSTGPGIDLRGYMLLPGLINAHDHLEFALFPRLGKGGYNNFLRVGGRHSSLSCSGDCPSSSGAERCALMVGWDSQSFVRRHHRVPSQSVRSRCVYKRICRTGAQKLWMGSFLAVGAWSRAKKENDSKRPTISYPFGGRD